MAVRTTLIFHNWRAKLGSLALAIVLWLIIRQSVNHSAIPVATPPPPSEAVPRE